MRSKGFLAVLAGVAVVLAVTRAGAQSLGDVAKKEEERRKHTPAGKVYTNKDLGAVPPSSAPPPPAAATDARDREKKDAASSASGAVKDDKAKDDKDAGKDDKGKTEAKGQAYWAERRRTLQGALDRDSTYIEALQSRINALTADFVNRDDPVQRSKIERDRQNAVAELGRLKKQVEDDRKAIADLEEEARRAGVPPGWLR